MDVVESAIGHDDYYVAGFQAFGQKIDDLGGAGQEVGVPAARGHGRHRRLGLETVVGRQGLLAEDVGQDDPVGVVEALGHGLLVDLLAAGPAAGLEHGPDPAPWEEGARPGQGQADGGGVVGEVVVDGHAADLAPQGHPPLDAEEPGLGRPDGVPLEAEVVQHGAGGQGVADVVLAAQADVQPAQRFAAARHAEARSPFGDVDSGRPPVAALGQAERLRRAEGPGGRPAGVGALAVVDHPPAPRHQARQQLELPDDALEVGVDVGVVVLDAVDHQDGRPVVQELRPLVEVGGVVLVALDDEVGPRSEGVAGVEVERDPAHQERGIRPEIGQAPGQQRRGGGLAVGARHHHRRPARQEDQAQELRHGEIRDAGVQDGLQLRVAPGDGVAHHHEIGPLFQVCGVPALLHGDAQPGQEFAHGRIDAGVGAAHPAALRLQHAGERGHGSAADAEDVDGGVAVDVQETGHRSESST